MIEIASFSYLFGQNEQFDGYTVIDCRVLPDPEGKGIGANGTDRAVQSYVYGEMGGPASELFHSAILAVRDGENVAFGCLAGKNRSVAMAELVSAELTFTGISHRVTHWNLSWWL